MSGGFGLGLAMAGAGFSSGLREGMQEKRLREEKDREFAIRQKAADREQAAFEENQARTKGTLLGSTDMALPIAAQIASIFTQGPSDPSLHPIPDVPVTQAVEVPVQQGFGQPQAAGAGAMVPMQGGTAALPPASQEAQLYTSAAQAKAKGQALAQAFQQSMQGYDMNTSEGRWRAATLAKEMLPQLQTAASEYTGAIGNANKARYDRFNREINRAMLTARDGNDFAAKAAPYAEAMGIPIDHYKNATRTADPKTGASGWNLNGRFVPDTLASAMADGLVSASEIRKLEQDWEKAQGDMAKVDRQGQWQMRSAGASAAAQLAPMRAFTEASALVTDPNADPNTPEYRKAKAIYDFFGSKGNPLGLEQRGGIANQKMLQSDMTLLANIAENKMGVPTSDQINAATVAIERLKAAGIEPPLTIKESEPGFVGRMMRSSGTPQLVPNPNYKGFGNVFGKGQAAPPAPKPGKGRPSNSNIDSLL